MATESFDSGRQFTKTLLIYRNGDSNFMCKKINYNSKQLRTFDSFLDNLTPCIKPERGAVRNIYTPGGKHSVKDFDELEDGKAYVATGQERFKKCRYTDIEPPNRRAHRGKKFDYNQRNNKYTDVTGRVNQPPPKAKVINCYPNGDNLFHPKVIVIREDEDNWEAIFQRMDDRIKLQNAQAISRVYTMQGQRVTHPRQLESGEKYVVSSWNDHFKRCDYKEKDMPNFAVSSPRGDPRYPVLPPIGSHKGSPESSVTSKNSNRRSNRNRREQEENGGIPNKPIKHKRSSEKRQVDYDEDRGGVFKAKNRNRDTTGAREVRDTRHTRTDLPIDQVEAEEVKLQNLDDNDIDLESNDNGESLTSADSYNNRKTNSNKSNKNEKDENAQDEKEVPSGIELSKLPSENVTSQNEPTHEEDTEELPSESRNLSPEYNPTDEQENNRRNKNTHNYYSDRHDHQHPQSREADKLNLEEPKNRNHARDTKQRNEDKYQRDRSSERYDRSRNRDRSNERDRKNRDYSKNDQQTSKNYTNNKSRSQGNTDTKRSRSRDRNSKEDKAATQIQASYKGYRTRKNLKESKKGSTRTSSIERKNKSATKIQAHYRGHKTRKDLSSKGNKKSSPRASSGKSDRDKNAAATKIQAQYKGHATRKNLNKKREEAKGRDSGKKSKEEQEKAAINIQSHYKGYKTRKELNKAKSDNEQRKNSADKKKSTSSSNKDDKKNKAASTIQANYKGYRTRKQQKAKRTAEPAY